MFRLWTAECGVPPDVDARWPPKRGSADFLIEVDEWSNAAAARGAGVSRLCELRAARAMEFPDKGAEGLRVS